MKNKPDAALDRTAFEKMKRIMPGFLALQRPGAEAPSTRPLPEEIAFKLTNECNLRCAHCYQWNDSGHHHSLEPVERRRHLPFEIITEVFETTRNLKSNVYLWGGEPLLYRHWADLADLLERDPRWTSICTNGLLIHQRIELLVRISSKLEMDVAVDGLEREHDGLRGRGAFEKTLRGIKLLLDRKRRGEYKGEITVNCVITDPLVPRVMEVVRFWDQIGIDTLYLGLLWYLNESASEAMDCYVAQHMPWDLTKTKNVSGLPSWHAYKYRMNPDLVRPLLKQIELVNEHSWQIKVRYNPALPPEEVSEFLTGSPRPVAGKSRCLAVHSRMDVLANGDVVSCKFFPETYVGNLSESTTELIWRNAGFQRVRDTIETCGLMPVCAKCSLLYSRGI